MINESSAPAPIADDAAEHLVESYGAGATTGSATDQRPHTPTLAEAVAHLREFRATFNVGDQVDEESGLTADDFDVILREIEHVQAKAQAEDQIIATAGDLA